MKTAGDAVSRKGSQDEVFSTRQAAAILKPLGFLCQLPGSGGKGREGSVYCEKQLGLGLTGVVRTQGQPRVLGLSKVSDG